MKREASRVTVRAVAAFVGCAVLLATISVFISTADCESEIGKPKISTKVVRDFDNLNLKAINFVERPPANDLPVKAAVFDSVCKAIKQAGYEVSKLDTSHIRLHVHTYYYAGMSVRDFAIKMGFEPPRTDADDYWLHVRVQITVHERPVYLASCRMWHKFVPTHREHSVGWDSEVWPVDEIGEGPNNLQKATAQIGQILMKDLPRAK